MDGTDNPKDTSASQDSSEGKQETSATQARTFTEEEQKKAIEKAVNDALAAAGRDAKSMAQKKEEINTLLQKVEKTQANLKKVQEEQERRELEEARSDPDRYEQVKKRQGERAKEAELGSRIAEVESLRTQLAEAQKSIAEITKEQNARDVATRHTVDYKDLMQFTDGSKEAMEALAQKLSTKKVETETKLKTDSGTTTGAGEILDPQKVLSSIDPSKMTPAEIHAKVMELAKAEKEGRIKTE